MTCWATWYKGLTIAQKKDYTERAGTTRAYVEYRLIPRMRTPRPALMSALAQASFGGVTESDLLNYFYTQRKAA
jgi:hypothetical protein